MVHFPKQTVSLPEGINSRASGYAVGGFIVHITCFLVLLYAIGVYTINHWPWTINHHPSAKIYHAKLVHFFAIYPLVNKHSYWKSWFIVDLPINSMVIFNNYVNVYRRVEDDFDAGTPKLSVLGFSMINPPKNGADVVNFSLLEKPFQNLTWEV